MKRKTITVNSKVCLNNLRHVLIREHNHNHVVLVSAEQLPLSQRHEKKQRRHLLSTPITMTNITAVVLTNVTMHKLNIFHFYFNDVWNCVINNT